MEQNSIKVLIADEDTDFRKSAARILRFSDTG